MKFNISITHWLDSKGYFTSIHLLYEIEILFHFLGKEMLMIVFVQSCSYDKWIASTLWTILFLRYRHPKPLLYFTLIISFLLNMGRSILHPMVLHRMYLPYNFMELLQLFYQCVDKNHTEIPKGHIEQSWFLLSTKNLVCDVLNFIT